MGGETNNYSGWDGWVEVSCEVDNAPAIHRSLWELSTNRKVEGKIREDYQAANTKELPHGWDRRNVIYVAATFRSLTPPAKQRIRRRLVKEGLLGLVWVKIHVNQIFGSMQVRTLSRRYSSSRSPYARRWMTRILLLSPSTNPSETLFSGLQ